MANLSSPACIALPQTNSYTSIYINESYISLNSLTMHPTHPTPNHRYIICTSQVSCLREKRFLPGPALVLPFIGNTTKFCGLLLARTSPVLWLSPTNYLFGRFIIYIYSLTMSSPTSALTPSISWATLSAKASLVRIVWCTRLAKTTKTSGARRILRSRSLSQGSSHLHFNPATHYSRARKIVPRSLRMLSRDMNLETSQTVFVGPYLSEEDSNRFNVDYIHFNIGLIKLPINLQGLAFRKARLARGKLVLTPAR